MPPKEKRKAARIKQNIIVSIKPLRGVFDVEAIEGIMLDLSRTGMAVLVRKQIPMNTMIVANFKLIDMRDDIPSHIVPVKVTGEVRYDIALKSGEYQLGISFTTLDEKITQVIGRFLEAKGA